MKSGNKIEIDDTPYIIQNGQLYVYGPTGRGYDYIRIGEVEGEYEEKYWYILAALHPLS